MSRQILYLPQVVDIFGIYAHGSILLSQEQYICWVSRMSKPVVRDQSCSSATVAILSCHGINYFTRIRRIKIRTICDFPTCRFLTLSVSSTLINGPASFAIASRAKVSLYKWWSLRFGRERSAKSGPRSTGRPFCSLSQDGKTPTAHAVAFSVFFTTISSLLDGVHVCSRYTCKTSPRFMLRRVFKAGVTLEIALGVLNGNFDINYSAH